MRQGCSLSPSSFPILMSASAIWLQISLPLYAHDPLIIITQPPEIATSLIQQCVAALKDFTTFWGFHVNQSKSAFLLKGAWPRGGAAGPGPCMRPPPRPPPPIFERYLYESDGAKSP